MTESLPPVNPNKQVSDITAGTVYKPEEQPQRSCNSVFGAPVAKPAAKPVSPEVRKAEEAKSRAKTPTPPPEKPGTFDEEIAKLNADPSKTKLENNNIQYYDSKGERLAILFNKQDYKELRQFNKDGSETRIYYQLNRTDVSKDINGDKLPENIGFKPTDEIIVEEKSPNTYEHIKTTVYDENRNAEVKHYFNGTITRIENFRADGTLESVRALEDPYMKTGETFNYDPSGQPWTLAPKKKK